MKLIDLFSMAVHNLWSRKLRTTLNLIGIVLSCVMLILTFAGTRGVRKGLTSIVNSSQIATHFTVFPGLIQGKEPPPEAIAVDNSITGERRDRLQERLRRRWKSRNARRPGIKPDEIAQLREIENIEFLKVAEPIQFDIKIGARRFRGMIDGADPSPQPQRDQRLIAGNFVQPDDPEGIVLSEFSVFDLGYQNDEQLNSLIGQSVELSIVTQQDQLSQMLTVLGMRNALPEKYQETAESIRNLLQSLQDTELSANDKANLKALFKNVTKENAGKKVVFTRKFIIRGIVAEESSTDGLRLLRVFRNFRPTKASVGYQEFEKVHLEMKPNRQFLYLAGKVDDVANLKPVTEKIHEQGYRTQSIVFIVDKIDKEVSRARIALAMIALLILVIVGIGISNTMVISVIERTPEFGIMKAVGAKSSNILCLVLFEGAGTGLIGAAIAFAISIPLSQFIDNRVRDYITRRIGSEYSAELFSFTSLDLVMVFGVAILVCSLASILPAFRASRLDPVEAMKRN